MDTQEAFNRIVTHLRKQQTKSVSNFGMCMYRGLNGKRCAVGVLLTDEIYDPTYEGQKVSIDCALSTAIKQYYPNIETKLLVDMQNIHDICLVSSWEDKFKEIARIYNLTVPPKDWKGGEYDELYHKPISSSDSVPYNGRLLSLIDRTEDR